jgi:NADH-quinone oxidoreductase subunit L
VRPYIWVTRINKNDVMDWITKVNVHLFRGSNLVLSELQNGNLRWYVGGIGLGAMILLGLVILL